MLLAIALLLPGCAAFKRCAYAGFGGRDSWQQPERVVESLALSPGDRVADLGAGGGYFTFRLAEAVGEGGRVFAIDVDESMIRHLARQAEKRGHANVTTVLAPADDPSLPDGGVDLVFSCNTYHHLEERPDYFAGLRKALPAGGRVAILDYDRPSWLRSHFSERQTILDEMQQAGFELVEEHDFVERQSFLIFAPQGDD